MIQKLPWEELYHHHWKTNSHRTYFAGLLCEFQVEFHVEIHYEIPFEILLEVIFESLRDHHTGPYLSVSNCVCSVFRMSHAVA